ncbi:molybdate ABC transporter substrate-binding protein [Acetobacterium bakii]|uniref:Molybdate ABC transporter substrate-binding protein n=1 Tax=Acetobacterium bakii TaxID=52689 RepID=A0A0L6U4N8_9FIRM|nr:molybdate ABC transporter substrate-binding protein [Acetobacterium bakii]KNZ43484.1 molybdate ABC transporter substrate-binding protein [Acetobacterium bakii]
MKATKKWLVVLLVIGTIVCFMSACSSKSETKAEETTNQEQSLSGQTVFVYCGAGMTKPFGAIADAFKEETGCEMEVVYANAAQLQNQILTTGEGDLFIAGSADELTPVKDSVTESKDLVKHVPVLAVKSANPLGILGLNDLTKEGVEVVLGDADATPIGKIANKALTDLGILNNVNVIARAATAPEIFNALSVDECSAIIVWKENVTGSSTEIVKTSDLDAYVKTVPAAKLSSSKNTEALEAFMTFLDSDAAKNIWKTNGYEVLN